MSELSTTIEFDAASHTYRRDGTVCPSVTQILTELSIIDTRWYTQEGADRGHRVHATIARLEEGRSWDPLPDEELPYITSFLLFKHEHKAEMQYVERIVHHPVYSYAGTVDWVGTIHGRPTILDFKTGQSAFWHTAQLSMYAACVTHDGQVPDIATVLLKKDSYALKNHTYDEELVRAICRVYRFKALKE